MKKKSASTQPLRISRQVLAAIHETIGSHSAEHGGMLGGTYEDGIVTEYYFDQTARRSGAAYSPDTDSVNRLLKEEWNPRNVRLLGFVHSHPPGIRQLSSGDLKYAERILQNIPELDALLLPLVMSEVDTGRFEVLPFAVVRKPEGFLVEQWELLIVEDAVTKVGFHEEQEIAIADAASETRRCKTKNETPRRFVAETQCGTLSYRIEAPFGLNSAVATLTFERVRGAYDLDRLANCRVIYVGCGGAASFAEDLARAGVGEHVLIDPDIVSESNLATQQAYRRDLGRPKVDCIAERISDINPNAAIIACRSLLDDLSDDEFQLLCLSPMQFRGTATTILLCGLTDSFPGSGRINRLALKFGLPSLCAQVYQEGLGAEITFTYPGLTAACHRCVLRSRYEAYLNNGFKNNVTSDGTPICATTRLNALKVFIALALLHHGTTHPRWGGLLQRIGNRNLIQIRMDPQAALPVFSRVFGGGDQERILFDEAVWLPQLADAPATGFPPCPDCGGMGDLRTNVGKFLNTRQQVILQVHK